MAGGYVILDETFMKKFYEAVKNDQNSFVYEGAFDYLKKIAECGKLVHLPGGNAAVQDGGATVILTVQATYMQVILEDSVVISVGANVSFGGSILSFGAFRNTPNTVVINYG